MTIKIFRVRVQKILRQAGLLSLVEKLRYYQRSLKYRKSNKAFIKKNPGFSLPPAHLAFDAYDAPKWKFYQESGEGTAMFIKELSEKYFGLTNTLTGVYEWGCGPGRVIRYLPEKFGASVEIYGSDYNAETIEWCKKNIIGVHFELNELTPPLIYSSNKFDLIYCISVFTHLSKDTGEKWICELSRILKTNGILILTTLGKNSFSTELLPDEKTKYQQEGIVVRGKYKEGRKMFLSFHNPEYVRGTLLKKFEVVEHIPTGFPYISQECWVARKINL